MMKEEPSHSSVRESIHFMHNMRLYYSSNSQKYKTHKGWYWIQFYVEQETKNSEVIV